MPSKNRRREIPPQDFQNSSWLPGTAGNPLDLILTSGKAIEKIPGLAFFILLAFLAAFSAWTNPLKAVILLLFYVFGLGTDRFSSQNSLLLWTSQAGRVDTGFSPSPVWPFPLLLAGNDSADSWEFTHFRRVL
jgi:hypothetical protein